MVDQPLQARLSYLVNPNLNEKRKKNNQISLKSKFIFNIRKKNLIKNIISRKIKVKTAKK